MAVSCRDLRADDLGDIAWSGSPSHVRHVAEALDRAARGEVAYLAVVMDGRILGIGGVDYTQSDGTGTLWQLPVHPDHQSQGIGTALIGALEQRARDRGCGVAELSVEKDNPRARSLYERLGYQLIGEVRESWEQEGTDGTLSTHHADCWHMQRGL